MTRLTWGDVGARFFETGVDRGVLYVGGSGVAWSGLTSVEESPTGGDPKSYYIDAYKYANVAAAEEFEATIKAYSSPKEFGPCDGTSEIYNGLIATQQPRRPFNFSYRTKIGNDVDGVEHAYKIHLVYNALAKPTSRSNTSLTQENSAQDLSWTITTRPPRITGIRPTAHFVIDTRYTPADILSEIEDLIYGNVNTEPTCPTVGELMAIFGAPVYDAGDLEIIQTTILDAGGA